MACRWPVSSCLAGQPHAVRAIVDHSSILRVPAESSPGRLQGQLDNRDIRINHSVTAKAFADTGKLMMMDQIEDRASVTW
jgi:hypothetical protein